ncbi:hypothetical protein SLEP1_g17672 [Rubroshorea leprosula]|uniref:Uncharacterized protein n=1 Tax=Rubroshorea leprosula TaxID=152421 RepID=A0AAV5J0K5_9ROSI|nr:hypothetical protein SLEP1_g17672 [Rubroshorea leprosula]
MDEPEKQNDLEVKRLSLIDVSREDDCLFNSPIIDPINPKSPDGARLNNVEKSADFLDAIDVREPSEFSEPENGRKSEKYNLRNSLAWDSAFFTSDGVLDPEELSSIIGGAEKCKKHLLPIQEDINRSCDSLTTTIGSDALTLESLEADLFGDIRASIQKSTKASVNANSSVKKESGVAETQTVLFSALKKVEPASQNKMNLKASPTKPSVGIQASGKKSLKQVSVRPLVSKMAARTRESSSALPKLPKVQSVVTPIPKTSSKKDLIVPKHVKMEKDAKSGNVVRAPVLKTPVGGSRNIIPRTKPHSRTSSYSSASNKAELTTSCSSLDSCGSASSCSMAKSPFISMKRKNESRTVNNSSSGSIVTNPSRIASEGKIQTGSSQLSALLKSVTSLSSSISSAGSISASQSLSPNSAVRQRSNNARASIGTGSCKGVRTSGIGSQAVGSLGGCVKMVPAGTAGLTQPASMKPSGLRLPSPKIGFFDGVRSSGRSPNVLSRPSIVSSLPKSGPGTVSPSGSSNRSNLGRTLIGRTQTANRSTKTANQGAKTDVKQTSGGKPRSLLLQESPNAVKKVSSSSRNIKNSHHNPSISPIHVKSSPRNRGGSHSKDLGVGSKRCSVAKGASNFGLAEKNEALIFPEQVLAPEISNAACLKDTKIVPPNRRPPNTGDDGTDNHPSLKTDSNLHYNTNEKEEAHKGAAPISQVGAVDVNLETQKELIGNSSPTCSQDEVLVNDQSKLTPHSSLTTSEITTGPRIPLSAKNSICNRDGPIDISTGSTVLQAEKIATLPISENILPGNT